MGKQGLETASAFAFHDKRGLSVMQVVFPQGMRFDFSGSVYTAAQLPALHTLKDGEQVKVRVGLRTAEGHVGVPQAVVLGYDQP